MPFSSTDELVGQSDWEDIVFFELSAGDYILCTIQLLGGFGGCNGLWFGNLVSITEYLSVLSFLYI